MTSIDCSQDIMNELMEFVVESIAEEGLNQLKLSEFHAKIEIDESTLEKLANKTHKNNCTPLVGGSCGTKKKEH